MNLILTNKCNKGCPYCFAHEYRGEFLKEFDFDNLKELINNKINGQVKLLGGEPTQYSHFKELLEFLSEKRRNTTLISNFLFSEEIRNLILNNIQNTNMSYLANATDLDKLNRLDIWSKNYNEIYSYLYQFDKEENLSIGITLEKERTLEYYISYLINLKESILNIERLRISLNFPGEDSSKIPNLYIKDYESGRKIIGIIQWCINNNIEPSLDCIIFPCMFENKEEFKFMKRFLSKYKFKCMGAPSDVFENGIVSYCYPLKNHVKIDIKNYKNESMVYDSLKSQYTIINSLVDLPEECKECIFKENNICNGVPLCLRNLSDIDIPDFY